MEIKYCIYYDDKELKEVDIIVNILSDNWCYKEEEFKYCSSYDVAHGIVNKRCGCFSYNDYDEIFFVDVFYMFRIVYNDLLHDFDCKIKNYYNNRDYTKCLCDIVCNMFENSVEYTYIENNIEFKIVNTI